MSDTIGSIIDKLVTANNKMFMEQEKLYHIRRQSFSEFMSEYFNETKMKELHDYFIKAADLNLQRNAAIDEIDLKIIEMVQSYLDGKDLDNGSFVQRKHKTA